MPYMYCQENKPTLVPFAVSRAPILVQNFAPLNAPLKAPLKTSLTKLLLKYSKEHSKEQIFAPESGPCSFTISAPPRPPSSQQPPFPLLLSPHNAGVMEVDFLPHENETGEKKQLLMPPPPPLLPTSASAKALSELRSRPPLKRYPLSTRASTSHVVRRRSGRRSRSVEWS